MCGIAGILDYAEKLTKSEKQKRLEKALNVMRHRGPDDGSTWTSKTGKCVMGHRRLSILDLSKNGQQPMLSQSGNICISYNGEIYNFENISKILLNQKIFLRTQCDTEVLLEAFEWMGEALFSKLDGMYASSFYNVEEDLLTLVRDPIGEKPLYYYQDSSFFAFASELHSLQCLISDQFTIDPEAIGEYLLLQYIHAPKTIFKGVKKLCPGSYLQIKAGRVYQPQHFYKYKPEIRKLELSEDKILDQLEEILVESVRSRLKCDVPWGIFLSGGIDSSLITAIATKRLNLKPKTFSLGFEGSSDSEHLIASKTAQYLGSDHYEFIARPHDFFRLEKIAQQIDEPNADTSILPTYLLSKFAAQHIKVAISGDGGDELFGGYKRYAVAAIQNKRLQNNHSKYLNWKLGSSYYDSNFFIFSEKEVSQLLQNSPKNVFNFIEGQREIIDKSPYNLFDTLRSQDLQMYLPGAVLAKMDRASMLNSLEVRAPFLSGALLDFSQQLPEHFFYKDGICKSILRKLFNRLAPDYRLDNKKMGFGLPSYDWRGESIKAYTSSKLLNKNCYLNLFFKQNELVHFVKEQMISESFSLYKCWSLLFLEFWLHKHYNQNRTLPEDIYENRLSQIYERF